MNLEPEAGVRFFLEFTGADGTQHRESLAACVTERFENALPVRSFQWAKGASHFPGSWWSSTTGDHVGFESWLERDHVMAMDFDPDITGIASQPFWLHWQDEDGRDRRHAPDFFARRADGSGLVVDVRSDDRIPVKDAGVFRMTAMACGRPAGNSAGRGRSTWWCGRISGGCRDTGTAGAASSLRLLSCWRHSLRACRCWPARCRSGTRSRSCRRPITCSGACRNVSQSARR